MELIVIIAIGLIALGVVISSFVRSSKKEKDCCSKYGHSCNNYKLKDTDDKNKDKN